MMKIEFLETKQLDDLLMRIHRDGHIGDYPLKSMLNVKNFLRTEVTALVADKEKKAILYTLKNRGIHGDEYDEIDVDIIFNGMKKE